MNSSLRDLEKCIEIHKRIINSSIREKENLIRALGPASYKTGTSYNDYDSIHGTRAEVNISDIVEKISRLDNLIYLEKCIIENTEKDIQEIKESLKGLKGIGLKIRTMQLVEGKTLKQIANDLNYSYSYIRQAAISNT